MFIYGKQKNKENLLHLLCKMTSQKSYGSIEFFKINIKL